MVTGGAGFLGRHLLPLLLQAGANVTIFSRSPVSGVPAKIKAIAGNCADAISVSRATVGMDMIIHTAGLLFGADWRAYFDANYQAARNIGQAARASGSRVIFISSLAAAGPCGTLPGRSESEPSAPVSAYGWSKLLAENTLAYELGNAFPEKLVILRPPIIYGSGDRGLLPLFRSVKRGFGISPANFPVSIIHADDCARAILLAALPAASGIYHLSDGEKHIMADVCRAMGRAQGRDRVTVLTPPRFIMGATAAISGHCSNVCARLAPMLGYKNFRAAAWNLDKYRESAQSGWLADSSRIIQELSFSPEIQIDAGMAEAVAGYRREGWL